MTKFLLRDYIILPKKELDLSPWVRSKSPHELPSMLWVAGPYSGWTYEILYRNQICAHAPSPCYRPENLELDVKLLGFKVGSCGCFVHGVFGASQSIFIRNDIPALRSANMCATYSHAARALFEGGSPFALRVHGCANGLHATAHTHGAHCCVSNRLTTECFSPLCVEGSLAEDHSF